MGSDFVDSMADLKEDEVMQMVRDRMEAGESVLAVLDDARKAMEIVGSRFAEGTYFVPDLVYSGEIMREINALIKPSLMGSASDRKRLGKFLIGTVAGDIHDIGKDIVSFMLDVAGFEVIDMGIDVPAERFVEQVRITKPDILGLSGLLTVAFDGMKKTIEAIAAAGLRNNLKIVIGGSMVDEQVRVYSGADAFCKDAMCGVLIAKKWIGDEKV